MGQPHFAAMTLLMLPLEALALRLAFHRVGGVNYPEWLVVATFLTAQSFLFWMGKLALQRWVPAAVGWGIVCSLAFQLFSLVQFFAGYPWWKAMLRGIVGLGLFSVAQSFITGLVMVASGALR